MSDDAQFCDLDTYLEANQSPGLKPVKPNLEPSETPPPFVSESSTDSSDSEVDDIGAPTRQTRRKNRGPKNEDIARLAGEYALESASDSEGEQEAATRSASGRSQMLDVKSFHDASTLKGADHRVLAAAAFKATQRLTALTTPPEDGNAETYRSPRTASTGRTNGSAKFSANGTQFSNGHQRKRSLQPAPSFTQSQKQLDVRPPPRLPQISTDPSDARNGPCFEQEESLATSPALAKFTINPANADPERILPAMQKSPARSMSSSSSDHKHTLPSLTTALNMNDSSSPSFSGHPPGIHRPSPSQFGPSPSSYHQSSPRSGMSPPGLPSAPSFWRTNTGSGSVSTLSEYSSMTTSTTSTTTMSTPTSVLTKSPSASYPTPTNSISGPTRQDSHEDTILSPGSDGHMSNGLTSNSTLSGHSFKCNVPHCTAAPFQTQYLLNSHMNVHSNQRPHFCPVKGCLRGPGGQGFKRKNEMIRHGLVHTSPGYMCPFCPDQQHKYPRPDNLQRHVRVHHVDKDRDDTQLRDVLAQRPEGGNRGRRRRLNS